MDKIIESNLDKMIEKQKELYLKEIGEFKEVGHKFINGEINSNEFKASSGGMGVYAQRGGKEFMIRLRVLSGILDLNTLNLINEFVKDYNLASMHMTTREAIQLHDMQFDDVISVMERSMHSNLFTRGGGGNFPRNVSLSPLSGVEIGEAFDVTPYAFLVNKYFLSRMNQYKLPRKFKVAFSNNENDTANATIADLGFLAVNQESKQYFKAYIGGSLGNQGDISVPFDELVKPEDVLYHVETALRMLVEEGDFENKAKARMRFIVKRMGKEAFLNCYKNILQQVKESKNLDFIVEDNLLSYEESKEKLKEKLKEKSIEKLTEKLINNQPNLIAQKQDGLYTVVVHPKGGILKAEDLNNLCLFLQDIPNVQLRLSMEENIYVRNLSLSQAEELLNMTKHYALNTRLQKSVSCIGVPTCQIGIAESQALLSNILSYFEEQGFEEDILPTIHISGCLNSCSRHQVAEIGFQGKKKKVLEDMKEVYTLHVGGLTSEEDTHLAQVYGDLLGSTIPQFLYELALSLKEKQVELKEYLVSSKEEFDSILDNYLV